MQFEINFFLLLENDYDLMPNIKIYDSIHALLCLWWVNRGPREF